MSYHSSALPIEAAARTLNVLDRCGAPADSAISDILSPQPNLRSKVAANGVAKQGGEPGRSQLHCQRMKIDVSKINPNPFTTRPEIEGTFGVVASTHWIATAVGMATVEKGGTGFGAGARTPVALQAGRYALQQ